MEQTDFRAIAAQLRQPDGNDGIETAQRMSENNDNMIRRCIDHLPVKEGAHILELGPGGGLHLPYLLQRADGIQYTGADISATMVTLATNNNMAAAANASFVEVAVNNGFAALPFPDQSFDIIFTVNTLYFWDNAEGQAKELLRVLRPGGCLAVCFATEAFMQQLPFTQYGFHLYSVDMASTLLESAGFREDLLHMEQETVFSNAGGKVQRDFAVMLVQRPF